MTENHNIIPARHIHEECGVFGIFTPQEADVASYAYYALYSLQHRGQESAGIVVNDDGLFRSLRDTGLVSEVFPPEQLKSLGKGTIAVACGTEAVKAGVNAGKLVRALCQLTGGNGGGRPDSAMGGAGDPEKIAEALTRLPELI